MTPFCVRNDTKCRKTLDDYHFSPLPSHFDSFLTTYRRTKINGGALHEATSKPLIFVLGHFCVQNNEEASEILIKYHIRCLSNLLNGFWPSTKIDGGTLHNITATRTNSSTRFPRSSLSDI